MSDPGYGTHHGFGATAYDSGRADGLVNCRAQQIGYQAVMTTRSIVGTHSNVNSHRLELVEPGKVVGCANAITQNDSAGPCG